MRRIGIILVWTLAILLCLAFWAMTARMVARLFV